MNGPNDSLDYCIIADFRIVCRLWCEEERQHHYERRSITHILMHLIHKNEQRITSQWKPGPTVEILLILFISRDSSCSYSSMEICLFSHSSRSLRVRAVFRARRGNIEAKKANVPPQETNPMMYSTIASFQRSGAKQLCSTTNLHRLVVPKGLTGECHTSVLCSPTNDGQEEQELATIGTVVG